MNLPAAKDPLADETNARPINLWRGHAARLLPLIVNAVTEQAAGF